MPHVAHLEHLEDLPLDAGNLRGGENLTICNALNDLGLSVRGKLCLRAAGELEKQKGRNQLKINCNKDRIKEVLAMIEKYQASCVVRKIGYYDTFKMQEHKEDFDNNIRRLELAGISNYIFDKISNYVFDIADLVKNYSTLLISN